MSVGKRVADTVEKMAANDPEGALFQICAAIDATAARETGKSGRSSYKAFIKQNLALITQIAFSGRTVLGMNLAIDHASVKRDAKGTASIEDILYHVVRCGLYHQAALPKELQFTDQVQIHMKDGRLLLPSSLINGLIVAVVVSPANRGELCSELSTLNLGAAILPLNKLWGRREELLWLLDAIKALPRQPCEPRGTPG